MFQHYCKTAIRNLAHHRGYTFINILGLSIGLMVSLIILLWVREEQEVDQFHQEGDRIYRTLSNIPNGEAGLLTWETAPYPLIEFLSETYPGVEEVGAYDPAMKMQFEKDDKSILADGIYANAGFFQILTFPLLKGEIATAFKDPNSVLISESLAEKLLGPEWNRWRTTGQSLQINGSSTYRLAGVFSDPPTSSSLQFDFVLNLKRLHPNDEDSYPWGNFDTHILLKLAESIDPISFASSIRDAISINNAYTDDTHLIIQPYSRKYLYGKFENGKEAGGKISYVRLFSVAAIFLLLIACINFMNLTTARASRRSKEVGIRKTNGAYRSSLIWQFLFESFLLTFISLGIAVQLAEGILPYFRELTGKPITLNLLNPMLWGILATIGVCTALVAGSYPAFFLSSFRIAHVLKGKLTHRLGNGNIRKGLVVFQFVVSALLVVGALVVQQQVTYLSSKDVGLNRDNVLFFRLPQGARDKQQTLQNELRRIPGVRALTFANQNPLEVGGQTGDPQWEGMGPDDRLLFNVLISDHQFLDVMEIPVVSGRNFSQKLRLDSTSFLINETAAKAMKLDEPLGKNLEFWGNKGPIVGIVKDFHTRSLHRAIGPLIIRNGLSFTNRAFLRIDPQQTEEILAAVEALHLQHSYGEPFRYDFLEDRYLQKYKGEQRTNALAKAFALIGLFISCLGLLGLSTFVAEQRTKEIGIRKILGASIYQIVSLLSRDFLKLVLLALVLSLPMAYLLMNWWLEDFAYRIHIGWEIFALTVLMAVGIALATVGLQSLRAAISNPIDSLRSE
ncbi:MAG: ABC transporter permease [Bacteroidota bacterium]